MLTDQDSENEDEDDKVTLMTVHSAKGLEFDHVFVVGMEEDLFPSSMALSEARGLEEERRLFYVALTRARKTCTVTYAKSRFKNGQTNSANMSRFLREIDSAYVSEDSNLTFGKKETTVSDDFWGEMRENRIKREMLSQSVTNEKKPQSRGNIVSVNRATPSVPLSQEAKDLKVGNIIEHERFGRGEVTAIELSGNDRRAFVEFESAGKKQLLLKFAKFNIIE